MTPQGRSPGQSVGSLTCWNSSVVVVHVRLLEGRRRRCGRTRSDVPGIEAALRAHVSTALIESTNSTLRLLQPMAFGFKEPEQLIALAQLDRGGYCPPLPGRS